MKKLLLSLMFTSAVVCVWSQTKVTVEPNTKYQTIQGWGVSLAWWANIVGGWSEAKINDICWQATKPEELNLNIFRFNIGGGDKPDCAYGNHFRSDGGNMPGYRTSSQNWGVYDGGNDWRQQKVMNQLVGYRSYYSGSDYTTELFSCSPPWYMTHSWCTAGNWKTNEQIYSARYWDFGDYLACTAYNLKKAHGNWNISCIEPFNEPLSDWWNQGGNQEGCYVYPNAQNEVIWNLWKRLQDYGIGSLGISAADNNTVAESDWNMWWLYTNGNAQYKALTHTNTHTYSGNWEEKASLCTNASNYGGKQVWQTETGAMNMDWTQAPYIISYRQIEDLRNLKCPVWCDWQLISTDPQWGLFCYDIAAQTYYRTKLYYTRKQINSFIKKGYQIISSSSGNTVAAISGGTVIVVIVNPSSANAAYSIDMSKFKIISGYDTYRTSGLEYGNPSEPGENCKYLGWISSRSTTVNYTAPAFSTTTFKFATGGPKSAEKVTDVNSENKSELTLDVFPNPTTSTVNLKFAGIQNPEINIIDVNGHLVYKVNPIGTQWSLDVTNWLSKGTYIIQVKGSNKTLVNQLVVQ